MKTLSFILVSSLLSAQLPKDPARIQVFEAIPRIAKAGEPVELHWSASGTERVRLEPQDQDFPPDGRVTIVPRERTVFWLHASNVWGGQSLPLVVDILPEGGLVDPSRRSMNEGTGDSMALSPPASSGIWIQLAALAEASGADNLAKEVLRRTGIKVARFEFEDPEVPGRILHRVRIGPWSSIHEAKTRLRSLQAKLRPLQLKPFVAVD